MRQAAKIIIMLLSAAWASSSSAQETSCRDDQGQNRCAAEAQRKQLDVYGVAAIEDLASQGAQVVRAFYVDGYGRDAGLVTFVRGPASEPRVEWRAPKQDARGAALTSIVPLSTWEALQARGYGFDRALTPERSQAEAPICLHSWLVRVETVEGSGRSRRSTQSACDEGLTVRYGFEIAKAAISALPSCALLDAEKSRNDVTRLADCTLLAGDRAAAAQAYNAYRSTWFANPRGPDFAAPLRHMFHDEAELSWPGQLPVRGSAEAARIWASSAGSSPFRPVRIIGETPDRVRFEGAINVGGFGPEATARPVPTTMIWTRENGFGFRLRNLVGAPPRK